MTTHPLDNPIWASLSTRHQEVAQGEGGVLRYPADIAPFLGVSRPDVDTTAALESLVAPDESVYLLGPELAAPVGWRLKNLGLLAQMICPQRMADTDGTAIIALTDAHRADVLALTALVYPHYFRPQTMRLGRYFGIYKEGCLAAMIGERMGTELHREISAVCTHPEFSGQGYARVLLNWLSNDLIDRGYLPFLHVSPQNQRAKLLYEQNGYHTRHEIAFWSLCRDTSNH